MKLKSIIQKIFINRIILLIFILSLLLYLLNPFYGSPVLYVNGDEPPNYMGALYMMINKDPFVKTSIYPPMGSYLQIPFLIISFIFMFLSGKVHTFEELRLFLITNQGYFLFVPRIISGILGSITIIYVYKLTKLIFKKDKYLPLLSAFLFMMSFNHGQMSNSGRPWTAAVFFFTLTIYLSLKSIYDKNNEIKSILLSGLYSACSFGFHQVGIFSLIFILVIRLFYICKVNKKIILDKKTISGVSIGITGILFFQLMRIYAPTTEWFAVSTNYSDILEKMIDLILSSNILYNLKQIYVIEPIIFFFFILSLFNKKTWKNNNIPVLVFTLGLFILLGISFRQPRYLLPAIMLMSIFSSSEIIDLFQKIKNNYLKSVFILSVIFFSSFNFIMWGYLYVQKPTFILAKEWIDNNISNDEVIVSTASRFMSYTPSKDFIKIQQVRHSNYYQAAYQYLNFGEYPENVRDIIYLGEVGDIQQKENVPGILKNLPVKFSYIIDIYFDPSDTPLKLLDKNRFNKIISFYPLKNSNSKLKISNLLTSIEDPILPLLLLKLERSGPYIDIYKIKS